MVLWLASISLLWTTWALGGVAFWAQIGSVALSLLCLIVAVWPSRINGAANFHALLRFVPFWMGLFVLLYMVVQVLNPSWVLSPNLDGRLVPVRQDYIHWLPNGIRTPIYRMNPLLMVMVLAPGWMLMCSIWAALRRPKSMRIMLWVMVLNASMFSVVGLLQAISHSKKMLWLFDAPAGLNSFWGMIGNPNHASAFMNLGLGAAFALILFYTGPLSKKQDLSKGGSFLMLIPFSVIILGGVVQAMSRAGILVAGIICAAFMVLVLYRFVRAMLQSGNRQMALVFSGVLALIVLVIGAGVISTVDMERVMKEMKTLTSVANDPLDDSRYYINMASLDLFERHPVLGNGAGCYRYFIGGPQQKYPQLMPKRYRLNLVFAHNDYINYLCDIGIVGSLPLGLCAFGPMAFVLFFRRKGLDSFSVAGFVALGAVLLHVAFEFFMQHPLVVMQFALLLSCITRSVSQRHHMRTRSEM